MPKNEARLSRVNEELKKELSNIISYELKNPNVTGMISVTKVKITPDFKYAKVYVSILNSKNTNKTMEGLKESAGFMRSKLAKTIKSNAELKGPINSIKSFKLLMLNCLGFCKYSSSTLSKGKVN